MKLLSGNGMHLAAWGAFLLHVFSNTTRLDCHATLGMRITMKSNRYQKLCSFGGVEDVVAEETGSSASSDRGRLRAARR